jgi:cytidylate kinase
MEKKHIITIAGKPGSGKSTTSKNLARTLNYTHFSAGDLFRALAKERGVDVYQHNVHAETDTSTDEHVDAKLREIGAEQDNLVIDSRMAWYWMPYSFKVYLDLNLEIAAQRILNGMDEHRMLVEHIPNDTHLYAQELYKRLESEGKRYTALYNQNPNDLSKYDLVVDTSMNNAQQVQEITLNAYKAWSN